MRFDCTPVEARDASGQLEAAGVRWTECRVFIEGTVSVLGAFCLCGGFMSFSAMLMVEDKRMPFYLGLALLAACYATVRWEWMVPGRRRELTFRRDGSILAHYGMAQYPAHFDRVTGHQADIGSIEAEQVVFPKGDQGNVYTHGVRIFFRGGQVAHMAKHLEPDAAHMLAVRLTQALVALREDMASATVGSARSNAGRTVPVEILID